MGMRSRSATWIVDRLEKLRLARRQVVQHDRRLKLVVLTRKGNNTRSELLKEFHQPPPEFAALDREDLEAIDRVLAKMSPTRSARPGSRSRRA